MSVRVNLLPEETRARTRAARQRLIAAGVAVAVLAVLGGVYAGLAMQLTAAEEELAAEQDASAALRAREAELVAYSRLQQRRDAADALLQDTLADEVSLAAVLQDTSLGLTDDAQLESFSATISPSEEPSGVVGTFTASARSLNAHAPGVERVLISFDQLTSFRELYLSSSTLEDPDDDVVTFTFDGQLTADLRTERYREGLPEPPS